ncbi:hypothetical protein WA1_36225 [Scytonema hofmannii PCC 7110]|uniref:Methyltransferase domain-containing protein n=1 Tax=Scytonema hofmannii PCC 7110 TaxID=128403 RepID=A0A139X1P7_9CYAN|nr:class I SAM-dependent methyltransferase [Scytonema hofmannii]KYC38627.1 hypothetical protein WA1_36225 [Scytonema hofmannii PCC 7110]
MNNNDISLRYRDGVSYDRYQSQRSKVGRTTTQNQDADFYSHLADGLGKNLSVLLAGGGTGRIAKPLIEHGHRPTILDNSLDMLDQARKKFPVLELIQADIRSFDLERNFELIVAHFDLLNHLLTLEDVESCFHCFRNHLASNGRFAFDVVNPNLGFFLSCLDRGKMFDSAYHDPYGNGSIVVTQIRDYDYSRQVLKLRKHYRYIDLDKEIIEDIEFRCYGPQELIALLKYNGFDVEQLYGDFQRGNFSSDSKKIIVVCQKK